MTILSQLSALDKSCSVEKSLREKSQDKLNKLLKA